MSINTTDTNTASAEFIDRVHAILPGVRERAPQSYELRRLPDETAADLVDAGVMRAMVPREIGGDDLPLEALRDVVLKLAAVDASAGWCAALAMDHSLTVGMFPLEAQAEVWGDGPDVTISSSIIPAVRIEAADGGYRLNGVAPFSSLSNHSNWALVGGVRADVEGPPVLLMCLVPASEYEVQDTWDMIGMRATGTNNLKLTDVFVPAHRVLSWPDLVEGTGPGGSHNADPKFRLPWVMYVSIGHACTVLGAAQGALEWFCKTTASRKGLGGVPISERPSVQEGTGRVAATLDLALAFQLALPALYGEAPFSLRTRARSMAEHALVSRMTLEAVEELLRMSGMSAHTPGHPLARIAADIRLATSHIGLAVEAHLPHLGRNYLGVEPPPGTVFF